MDAGILLIISCSGVGDKELVRRLAMFMASIDAFRGQALCTAAAVLGGKSLASQTSEKIVSTCSSLVLFFLKNSDQNLHKSFH